MELIAAGVLQRGKDFPHFQAAARATDDAGPAGKALRPFGGKTPHVSQHAKPDPVLP